MTSNIPRRKMTNRKQNKNLSQRQRLMFRWSQFNNLPLTTHRNKTLSKKILSPQTGSMRWESLRELTKSLQVVSRKNLNQRVIPLLLPYQTTKRSDTSQLKQPLNLSMLLTPRRIYWIKSHKFPHRFQTKMRTSSLIKNRKILKTKTHKCLPK